MHVDICVSKLYAMSYTICIYIYILHEKLFGILRVSNPATRKDLADRTWGGSSTNPK